MLKCACELHLVNTVTVDSAIDLILFADSLHESELMSKCLKFMAQNAGQIARSNWELFYKKASPQLSADFIERMARLNVADE